MNHEPDSRRRTDDNRGRAASGKGSAWPWLTRGKVFFFTLGVAAFFYGQFPFLRLAEGGDRANWVYMAQTVVRGGLLYRDAANIKSPLSAYLGAAAIGAGNLFGVRDLIAIRFLFMLLGILIVGLTFLLGAECFKSLRVGFLAALISLSFNTATLVNCSGIQPKTPMIVFGLIALLCTLRDRPFWAGLSGMLSALCWQPGLLFVGASGVGFSAYLTKWRDRRVLRLLVGATLPLALLLGHFAWAGALRELFLWCFVYNLRVYAPGELRTFGGLVTRLTELVGSQWPLVLLALAGLGLGLIPALRWSMSRGRQKFIADSRVHSIWIAAGVYALFCTINLQGTGDLFPFLPFVSMLSAFALTRSLDWTISRVGLEKPGPTGFWPRATLSAVLIGAIFAAAAMKTIRLQSGLPTLQDQEADVALITSHLALGDEIYVHGSTAILTVSGLPNASPHYLLDRGKDLFLAELEEGGFDGWLARLKSKAPKVVALSRLTAVVHGEDFLDWVRRDYEKRQGKIFQYYLRKGIEPPASETAGGHSK